MLTFPRCRAMAIRTPDCFGQIKAERLLKQVSVDKRLKERLDKLRLIASIIQTTQLLWLLLASLSQVMFK